MKNTIRVMHEQLDLVSGSPVKIKWCDYDYFKYPWHFHSEYEIVYIIKSTGTRFVGNSIEPFSDGDLILYGSFLPHMYRNDDSYYKGNSDLRVNAITVQFSKDFFSHAFQYYPEFRRIKIMLGIASHGIYFEKVGNDNIRRKIVELLKLNDEKKLLACVELLFLMSKSKYKRILNGSCIDVSDELLNDMRLKKVLGKLNREYHKAIVLDDIANFSGMNKSAFCRYFKKKTGKTVIQYINNLRIKYACNLLLSENLSISQICFECGFNNLSNFNKQFKKTTNYTPTEYFNQFRNDNRPIIVSHDDWP